MASQSYAKTPALKPRFRIVCRDNIPLGPGKVELLAVLLEPGSLNQAARRLVGLAARRFRVKEPSKGRRADPVIQFSVFPPNRLGRLHDLIRLLGARRVHVLGLMVLDTPDSAIIRVVVDDPDSARDLLTREGFPFTESKLVVVQFNSAELNRLMPALLEAEVNINSLY